MFVKITGLPVKIKYQDVKFLVRSECTINDFKLDNLMVDSDGSKKVLVTVGNEAEAFCLVKCLNGFRMSNNTLRVEPVSTKPGASNQPQQNTYEPRPGYPSQPRNDYPNQMGNNYDPGPNSYGQSVPHNMGPQRPVEPVGGRTDVWNSNNVTGNQWGQNQSAGSQGLQNSGFPGTPIYPQHPSMPQRVDSGSYADNRQNYGYPPKNLPDAGNQPSGRQIDMRSHELRSGIIDAQPSHGSTPAGRYPPSFQQEKPITIMKDNFQGPTMYQMGGANSAPYQGQAHGSSQVWNAGQEPKHQAFQKSSPAQYEKSYGDERRHSQLDKRLDVAKSSQDSGRIAYKDYEKGARQFSPPRRIPGRPMSPSMNKKRASPGHGSNREMLRRVGSPERKLSPMGMPLSGRRSPPNVSPPIRRVSPSGGWIPVNRPVSPPGRRISPSGRRISPSGRRLSPSGRRISPPGRRISPSARRVSPTERRLSPSGRRMSPAGRRISQSRRVLSPGTRVSPSGRRISLSGRRVSPQGRRPLSMERRPSPSGRRMSPSRRHISPSARRVSPSERRMSPSDRRMVDRRMSPRRLGPQKRASPSRRLESPPPGANSRQPPRYSPRRHLDDKMVDTKMEMDVLKGKQVRPAYESQASSQAMYSGGYRQNPKENVSYAMSAARPDQRISPWRQERDKNTYAAMKKQDDDRRDINEKRHPTRQSRSPPHRDRSPVRGRYRTNSPVSHSPRRSWALEKRPYARSPEVREAPPPPIWPGKNSRDDDPYKNKFTRVDDMKHAAIWDRPSIKIEDAKRLDEERRSGDDKRGMIQREMGSGAYAQDQREPKFTPRNEFEDIRKGEYQRQRDLMRRSPDRRDFREAHEDRRHDEYRRLPSPRREDAKKPQFHKEFDKDFEDIYKRAQEFRKKAEQMRRSGDRRRDAHSQEDLRDVMREEKYDRRLESSPHRRPDLDRHMRPEPDRERYEDPKYNDSEPEWKLQDNSRKASLPAEVKAKRVKASQDILEKIMRKYKQFDDLRGDQRARVSEEIRLALRRLFMDMFGEKDVSFIEIVIKYQSKISEKDEEALVHEVFESFPSLYRSFKRSGAEPEVPAKMARYSPETAMKEDEADENLNNTRVPDWDLNVNEPIVKSLSSAPALVASNLPPPRLVTPQLAAPLATPIHANFAASGTSQQFIAQQLGIPQMMLPLAGAHMSAMMQYVSTFTPNQVPGSHDSMAINSTPEEHKLFLCKDDFDPFTELQAELLKNFLVSEIIKVTETSQGWAPDLTLRGINSVQRYELSTNDEASKNWLVNLDFSGFKHFNVLVYTADELWYERAAIWLPGHSNYRSLEPQDKLKLQNRKLEGIKIGKWKFVKKVVNMKGTRLYVDMPPSAAGALEKHKMMLSYELQKVNVILKAVAVDKNAFDAGLKEYSMVYPNMLEVAVQNSPMPSLSHDPSAVQMTLKGNKTISIDEARKLKEIIIHHLFKYLQAGGTSKTDFVKYGRFPPNIFGIIPENPQSKRWLLSTQFGKVNHRPVIIVGGDDSNVKYVRMYMYLPFDGTLPVNLAIERLRRSNQGVKGINFHLWKPIERMTTSEKKRSTLNVEIDLESVDTLRNLKYKLDYVDNRNDQQTVIINSRYSPKELNEMIRLYKAEMTDSYDVANMELDSSDDDVVCLD